MGWIGRSQIIDVTKVGSGLVDSGLYLLLSPALLTTFVDDTH